MTIAVAWDVKNQNQTNNKLLAKLGVSGPQSVNILRCSGSSISFKFDGNRYF